MSKRDKKKLIRIIASLILFFAIFITDKIVKLDTVFNGNLNWLFPFALYLIVYITIGYDVIYKAFANIFHGEFLDENFLMVVATFGAFGLAIYRGVNHLDIEGFDEACAVLLFYQVGEFFQSYATGKSRKSITSLMDIRPDYANLKTENGVEEVDPEEVKIDDIIVVNPGEKIPLDGKIIKGASTLDTKALTGESLPKEVLEGDEAISGTINLTSQLEIKVEKEFYDSTVSKILELVENATSQKSKAENFITKFARFYTSIVVGLAVLLAIIPSLITGEWSVWIYRALSFLVVSCPCALVISIPLSFFAGIGAASKYGILIKGTNYLEKFNKANTFIFDKTGTLTKGNFAIKNVYPIDKKDEILHLASIAECNSNHPIALSIINSYGKDFEKDYVLTNVAGEGIIAEKNGEKIYCGNEKLMENNNINFIKNEEVGTVVYVAKNDKFFGSIIIADEIKDGAKETIESLSKNGGKTIMLTGDNEKIAESVAESLKLTDYKASLLPQNKVEEIDKIFKEKKKEDVICFVGDGINDAPSLMRSDIGIAMGGVGSDAAIEAADMVLMHDDLKDLIIAKKISKKTMRIAYENIIFSLAIKMLILILSAFGITNMWIAVFGDVGVAVIAILNAMRVNSKY